MLWWHIVHTWPHDDAMAYLLPHKWPFVRETTGISPSHRAVMWSFDFPCWWLEKSCWTNIPIAWIETPWSTWDATVMSTSHGSSCVYVTSKHGSRAILVSIRFFVPKAPSEEPVGTYALAVLVVTSSNGPGSAAHLFLSQINRRSPQESRTTPARCFHNERIP